MSSFSMYRIRFTEAIVDSIVESFEQVVLALEVAWLLSLGQKLIPVTGGSCLKYHFCHDKTFGMTKIFCCNRCVCHDKNWWKLFFFPPFFFFFALLFFFYDFLFFFFLFYSAVATSSPSRMHCFCFAFVSSL